MARKNNETTAGATGKANKPERDFLRALASQNDWRLGDDGNGDTVLICGFCDLVVRFPDRETATGFLLAKVECERCSDSTPIPADVAA